MAQDSWKKTFVVEKYISVLTVLNPSVCIHVFTHFRNSFSTWTVWCHLHIHPPDHCGVMCSAVDVAVREIPVVVVLVCLRQTVCVWSERWGFIFKLIFVSQSLLKWCFISGSLMKWSNGGEGLRFERQHKKNPYQCVWCWSVLCWLMGLKQRGSSHSWSEESTEERVSPGLVQNQNRTRTESIQIQIQSPKQNQSKIGPESVQGWSRFGTESIQIQSQSSQ